MPYPTDTGLSDEQAIKRQRYEDALDRFAGFEPGESQLTDDQIMARRAARGQAGAPGAPGAFQHQSPFPSFRQSTPGANAMPFETILAQLKARPGMIEHLEGIDLDGDGIPDIPFSSPPPHMMADPMARMQWQAMMNSRQQAKQAKQMRRAQRKAVNNEALLAHLRANDPLFEQVHAKIGDFVRTLSLKLQRPCGPWKRRQERISISTRKCATCSNCSRVLGCAGSGTHFPKASRAQEKCISPWLVA